MYTVEHYTTSGGGGGCNSQQSSAARHHQQHFETAESSSSIQQHQHYNPPPPVLHHTTTYEVQETFEPGQHIRVHHHHPSALSFESSAHHHHHELAKSSGALAAAASYKQEKHEKTQKTVQTTTHHSGAPMVITEEMYVNEVTHPLNATTVSEKNYEITVQHYPPHKNLSWSNAETYLHIFLTFYFGYFASVLFFDGIIRNIALLYILEHTYLSTTIYIVHILFSIVMLAFCIWFMTVCWRWWRHKSLEGNVDGTSISEAQAIKPANKNRRNATGFSGYVMIAAIILIIGFFVYLVLGLLDLSFKSKQDFKHYGNYHPSAYMCDVVIFVFRLLFWLVGIAALLVLGKERLVKYCCPSKQIKIGKERPVAVYQVTA